jgi:hypothetical protein
VDPTEYVALVIPGGRALGVTVPKSAWQECGLVLTWRC